MRVSRLLSEVQLREKVFVRSGWSFQFIGSSRHPAICSGLSSDVQELLVSLLCSVPWWHVIWPRAIISIYWETALGDSWCFGTPIVENLTLHSLLSVALQNLIPPWPWRRVFPSSWCHHPSCLISPLRSIWSDSSLFPDNFLFFPRLILRPWHLLHLNPLFSFLYHRTQFKWKYSGPLPTSSSSH